MDGDHAVSLIIPAYNADKFLDQAIRSALEQTIPFSEIVVIDDGSSDNTSKIARSFGDAVRLLQQSNSGVSVARNLGIEAARNRLLAFLDADDVMSPDRLEVQLKMFQNNRSLDVALGQQVYFSAAQWSADAVTKGTARPALIPSAMLCRSSVFQRFGLFDPATRGPEFVAWFANAMDLGISFEVSDLTIVYRRIHDSNLSSEQIRNSSEYTLIVKQFLDRKRAA